MRIALLAAAMGCGRVGFDARDPDAAAMRGFSRLIAYGDSTCAAYGERLYCWGENGSGQIDATKLDRAAPTPVPLPEGTLGAFTIGETHGCAVVGAAKTLRCWGEVTNTQVFATPTAVIDAGTTDVAAGKRFTCAVVGGQVRCWGVNDVGQLGDGTLADRDAIQPTMGAMAVTALDAGDDHACARTATSAVCWGHNDDGALGFGAFTPAQQLMPVPVVADVDALPAIAGWHACARSGDRVVCWGRNLEGALGDGTLVSKPTPTLVPGLDGVSFVATGGGPADLDASCAVHDAGVLACWGAGTAGRLGTGDTANVPVPTTVVALPAVAEVALGYAHTCALLVDGDVWCWGRGSSGQLGNGAFASSLMPVRVVPPAG